MLCVIFFLAFYYMNKTVKKGLLVLLLGVCILLCQGCNAYFVPLHLKTGKTYAEQDQSL